jgi:hypothetical protein
MRFEATAAHGGGVLRAILARHPGPQRDTCGVISGDTSRLAAALAATRANGEGGAAMRSFAMRSLALLRRTAGGGVSGACTAICAHRGPRCVHEAANTAAFEFCGSLLRPARALRVPVADVSCSPRRLRQAAASRAAWTAMRSALRIRQQQARSAAAAATARRPPRTRRWSSRVRCALMSRRARVSACVRRVACVCR